jgi:hypothetical protein
MKKILGPILLFAFLLPLTGISQKKDRKRNRLEKKAVEYYDRVFGDEHAMFSVTKVPDEFKEESKIIIGQQVHLALLRNTSTNANSTKVALRKRVYLNDEAAVNDFSEFYYQNSDVIGISIIKPNGTTNEVELSEAVKVTSDVPEFYQDKFHSDDYFKIALPGLEIGDIVDYFKVFNESYQGFIELVIPIGSEAPIVEQEIVFDVDKLWNSFYKSFNGAPKIKLSPDGGFDMKGRQRKSVKRLIFNAKNTPVTEDNRWSYDLLHTPLIKFMALPPGTAIGDKKQVSNSLDEKELFSTALSGTSMYMSMMKRDPQFRIKAMKLKDRSKDEAADVIYRMIRTNIFKTMEDPQSSYEDYSYFLSRNTRELPGGMFVVLFAELLDYVDIESDIVMVMPRSRGKLSNTILYSEPTLGVYIPSLKKYYWPASNFSLPGVTPGYLQGASGIKIKYALANKRKKSFSPVTIPASTIDDNTFVVNIDAQIGADNVVNMDNEMLLSGYYREYYSSLFLYDSYYLKEEFKLTKADKTLKELKKESKGKKSKKAKKKKKRGSDGPEFSFTGSKRKNFKEEKEEMFENWLKSDYEVTKVGTTEVLNSGMGAENNILHFKYDFTTDAYVNKAGPNLVFNIGKLIGQQVELTEEEINGRTVDVNYSTPRNIEYNISIKLPEGKTAKGLDGLNMSIVNEIGEFVSTAEQVGDVINVKTVKKYKNNSFGPSEWSKMVAFLEAGFQFTEKKVILK